MPLSIVNNVSSLNAQNNLTRTNSALAKSLERLSTGLKINRGADGPAGLVISEQQRAQVVGLKTAIDNTNKAVSLVQTAEGALNELNTLLNKVRGLALDSANSGVNEASALAANQAEINNAIATINTIANTTKFGASKFLLNGTAGITGAVTGLNNANLAGIVTGTGATAGTNTVVITQQGRGSSITAAAAGSGALSAAGTLTISGGGLSSALNVGLAVGDTTATIKDKVQAALDNASAIGGGAGKFSVALDGGRISVRSSVLANNAITVASSAGSGAGSVAVVSGFAAGAGQTSSASLTSVFTGTGGYAATIGAGNGGNLVLNGGGLTGSVTVALADGTTAANVRTAIQNALDAATAQGGGPGRFTVTDTGTNFVITSNVAGASSVTVSGSTALLADVGFDTFTATAAEQGQALTATVNGQGATVSAGDQGLFNQVNLGGANGLTFSVGITAGVTAAAAGSSTTVSVVDNALTFQIGANAGETAKVSIDKVTADRLGTGVSGLLTSATDLSTVNVTTTNGAQDAIRIIDRAITDVSNVRARLGAFQTNSLESNANNLRNTLENTQSAESVIRDTDFAEEIAKFTKLQTQLQAGSTVLGNANQQSALIAQLLRG